MRKISMFLICSTLLAVPAFAEECPEGKKYISAKRRCYTIAKTTDNAVPTAHNQPCYGDQKPAHSIITGWQYYPNGRYCVNACKQGDDYICCVCGVSSCAEGYKPNGWNTECVDDGTATRNEAAEEVDTDPVPTPDDCSDGIVTINGETSPRDCARDAEGGVNVVADNNVQCNAIAVERVEHATAGDWRSYANGTYACKGSGDNYVRCKCHITACEDDYEAAADGSSCQPKEEPQPEQDITQQSEDPKSISILAGRLAKVENQFGLSKWRTADGEFNKARLASDLTAGVVLGTTGALVTASVVKKKQVKEGFESLECTIGGQHVGDWGDTFHISGK